MSNGISNDALKDLLATTLVDLPNMEFETALDRQNFPVMDKWFRGEKKIIDSGTSITRNIQFTTTGNAQFVRLFQKTPINVADTQKQLTAPWTQVQTYFSHDRRELTRNRRKAAFVSLVKSRRVDAILDLAKLLENRGWLAPNSATDDLNPRGIPYWLRMSESGVGTGIANAGFIGKTIRFGDASTSTTCAGIDANTETMHRNFVSVYASVDATFVAQLRDAFYAVEFNPPVDVDDLKKKPSSYGIYMPRSVLVTWEELTSTANKGGGDYGSDLGKYFGASTFRRVPLIHTPTLNSVTYSPIYGINHDIFYPVVMEGEWLRQNEPMNDVEQVNVFTTQVDSTLQFFAKNTREAGFVLHTAIP
jgi:hypothetical protein